jgi:hypothetical protein
MLFSKPKKAPLFSSFDEFSDAELVELGAVGVSCVREAIDDAKRHWATFAACLSPSQKDEFLKLIEDAKRMPFLPLLMSVDFNAPLEEVANDIIAKYPPLKRPFAAIMAALAGYSNKEAV